MNIWARLWKGTVNEYILYLGVYPFKIQRYNIKWYAYVAGVQCTQE